MPASLLNAVCVCVMCWAQPHESAFLYGHLLCTKASQIQQYRRNHMSLPHILFHHTQAPLHVISFGISHGRGEISSEDGFVRTLPIQRAYSYSYFYLLFQLFPVIVLIVRAPFFLSFECTESLCRFQITYSLWAKVLRRLHYIYVIRD